LIQVNRVAFCARPKANFGAICVILGSSAIEAMRPIPKAAYRSAAELDEIVKQREAEAALLPPGEARQSILKEIARLRIYADAKRWLGNGS
jgi:hypothetical protein